MKNKRWVISTRADQEVFEEFEPWGKVMAQVLFNRGLRDRKQAEIFLNPQESDLEDPGLLKDMDKAVERILSAIGSNERIVIYGDYDVDGICSTTMLYELLKSMNAQVDYYIPDRAREGYGLNKAAIERIIGQGTKLILTVDCGISSPDEIGIAHAVGVDFIITDHHQVPEKIPAAHAIINPHQPGCPSKFKELAGVGVAYKLAQALLKKTQRRNEHDFLDLVALATVADIVPLVGENRTLVSLGLKVLNNTSRPGLRALLQISGCAGAVDSYHLGFQLGPRLNAAGRMTHATDAMKLLLAADDSSAMDAAVKLNQLNMSRQDLTKQIFDQIRDVVDQSGNDKEIIVVASEKWPSGIVGLVASKVCEEYYKPTLVIEQGENISRGSARSISGFDITNALTECSTLLKRFGGHAAAAGFEIENSNIMSLEQCLLRSVRACLTPEDYHPVLNIDAQISLDEVNYQTYGKLAKLAPFGYKNPRPVFVSKNLSPITLSIVGSHQDHLRFAVQSESNKLSGIGFGLGPILPRIAQSRYLDMAYSIDENQWQGMSSLQLKAKDIQISVQ